MLMWVVNACMVAGRFLESTAEVHVAVLIPKDDPIGTFYGASVSILEGDENDVLSRYVNALELYQADYVVRITADCPHIPPHHITKHVRAAITKGRDLTTNVHYRSFKEGWDCEVLSARLMKWIGQNADSDYDREHVTSLVSVGKPFPFMHSPDGLPSICHIMQNVDESHIKTSIDTMEEFEAAEAMYQAFREKKLAATNSGIFYT